MKRLISFLTLSALLLGSVTGCSVPERSATSVTASAGADKYVNFLEDNLETMPHSLVILSGDDTSAYGVDVTDFVDDEGFAVRASYGEVVILGKTDAGLDRGVRHFANYGNLDDYSFSYGEGYRVKKLTICGNDISEYAVIRPDDADECMLYAMSELVRYTELACGTSPTVYSVSEYASAVVKPSRTVSFIIDYVNQSCEDFSVTVKNDGNVEVLCGLYRGGLYGVYGLLHDMGWRFLGDGTEYVYESDHVDLTADINRTEKAAIANRFAASYPLSHDLAYGNRLNFLGRYTNAATDSKYGYYGVVSHACHGLKEFSGSINWGGAYIGFENCRVQPCYSDEAVQQAIEDHYRNYIEARLAAGAVIGKDLVYIDVSHFDSDFSAFCHCSNCMQTGAREGSSTGPVMIMTNRIADMAAKYSPKISVLMLAYCGTNKPTRRTVPRDNVSVAYCFYYTSDAATCSNHSIAGNLCGDGQYCNNIMYKEFEGWKKICPEGGLQVWYYPMNGHEIAFQAPSYDTVYDDMKYFIESGVDCIMLCDGENNDSILITALGRLLWDGNMSKEEYYRLVEEYFRIYYGSESGKYIYEYSQMIVTAGNLNGCWSSYGSPMLDKVNSAYITSRYEYIVGLFDTALKYAESEVIYNRIELLRARMLYMLISVIHEEKYVNGSEEEREYISRLYGEMHSLFVKYSIPLSGSNPPLLAPTSYDVTKKPCDHWFAAS